MGKRQEMREKRKRQQRLGRLAAIGLVSLGAVLVASLLIWSNRPTPVGAIVTVEPNAYPSANGRELGDPGAPVLIEVWEDFQCPACRNFSADTEPRIVEQYVATNQARYVFYHYPFLDGNGVSRRGESDQAANASMCAADRDRFWDYHDITLRQLER
jgi:protein-disulfide isomerase